MGSITWRIIREWLEPKIGAMPILFEYLIFYITIDKLDFKLNVIIFALIKTLLMFLGIGIEFTVISMLKYIILFAVVGIPIMYIAKRIRHLFIYETIVFYMMIMDAIEIIVRLLFASIFELVKILI